MRPLWNLPRLIWRRHRTLTVAALVGIGCAGTATARGGGFEGIARLTDGDCARLKLVLTLHTMPLLAVGPKYGHDP